MAHIPTGCVTCFTTDSASPPCYTSTCTCAKYNLRSSRNGIPGIGQLAVVLTFVMSCLNFSAAMQIMIVLTLCVHVSHASMTYVSMLT